MARLINADALLDCIPYCDPNCDKKISKVGAIADMVMLVSEAPTIDAVCVVRCRDCVHMKKQFGARFCSVWCMYNGMGDDGFCNYGERKTDA